MVIGIVGSDNRAVAIGRLLRHCGHTVTFSDPNDTEHAEKAAAALADGTLADSAYHQAGRAEALVMAVHWEELDRTLTAMGPYEHGIVIDAVRAPKLPHGSGAEMLAHKLDNPHVVKAFVEEPHEGSVVKVCGDDPVAMHLVEELISQCGCKPVELGPLSRAVDIEQIPDVYAA
jgi:predicted dinucleotide-binding enzyme